LIKPKHRNQGADTPGYDGATYSIAFDANFPKNASMTGKQINWDAARELTADNMLSIVMPAHNLAKAIAGNIQTVHKTVSAEKVPFEIIAVDDGSDDSTSAEIDQLCADLPHLKHIRLRQNSGKGAALMRGFNASSGKYILFIDADLDLPPDQTGLFFQIMKEESSDIVIGCKMHQDSQLSYPLHRRIMSASYFALVKALIGLPIRDTQTGIKLFKREALESAFPRMLVKQFAFDLELLSIAHESGFKISEAPVTLDFQVRSYPFRIKAIVQIAIDTLAIFYRTKILRYYKSIPIVSMPSPLPLVSVIVACPASSDYLEECIEALLLQDYKDFEVLILPDAPTNKDWKDSRIHEIATGAIRPAEKRNMGIQHAKGSLCAFLDDDAFPMDDWLQNAVLHFSDTEVGATGGPAATPPNDPFMAQLSGHVFSNTLVSGGYRYRYTPGRVREVEDYPSCNLIVRTEILRELDGFRTDFWPGEDTYLCMDIVNRCKKKIIYDPRILACHHRRNLFLPHLRQVARYALHRGYFARKFPATSRKISYAMPSLFVLGLISGGSLAYLWPPIRTPYILSVSLYAAITFLFAIHRNPLAWILVWLGIMSTHVVYGIRFVVGLLSKQMPETVALFDHPSESPNTPS
jgi:glycosyltransferase involved in cell wall biosynthesis